MLFMIVSGDHASNDMAGLSQDLRKIILLMKVLG